MKPTSKKPGSFYQLNGNNGATYILNANSFSSISRSLDFYKTVTFKNYLLKQGLRFILLLTNKFKRSNFKSHSEIVHVLNSRFEMDFDSLVGINSSVLISPTRDKIIINKDGSSFQKIAFGDSYHKVKNEGKIYQLLQNKTLNFKVSDFSSEEDISNKFYSFQMSNNSSEAILKKANANLVEVLVEFFNTTSNGQITIGDFLIRISKEKGYENFREEIERLQKQLKPLTDKEFPLGLVHRDFKPWNVKASNPIHIYDFEETIQCGPPLEDLLNYRIDPIIRYSKTGTVANRILKDKNVREYQAYLQKLKIDLNFEPFLLLYVLNRCIFWSGNDDEATSKKYKLLFEELIDRRLITK